MTKAPVVRGIVAGMFAISTAAAGLVLATSAAGAAPPPPNCTVLPKPAAATVPTPEPEPAHCATLEVTKVVTGAPAPGTTFAVAVDCVLVEKDGASGPAAGAADALPPGQTPPFTTTLTFPATGGTQDVFITEPGGDCTVTETPPPGCTLTSIDPVKTHVDKAVEFPVTVTNDCPAPPGAAPQAPAPVAVAVVEAPGFTG